MHFILDILSYSHLFIHPPHFHHTSSFLHRTRAYVHLIYTCLWFMHETLVSFVGINLWFLHISMKNHNSKSSISYLYEHRYSLYQIINIFLAHVIDLILVTMVASKTTRSTITRSAFVAPTVVISIPNLVRDVPLLLPTDDTLVLVIYAKIPTL